MKRLIVLGMCLLTGAGSARAASVATWNLQWLVSPHTAHESRQHCHVGRRSRLPCDVAIGQARSHSDFAALRRAGSRISADVIAVQEVEDESTLLRVFPGHGICLTRGPGQQQLGFVVRPGVRFRCLPDYTPLGLEGRLRPGAQLLWLPEGRAAIHMLAVHLKSGCAEGARARPTAACGQQARQWPRLEAWVQQQVQQQHDYIVLGDFNRIEPLPAGLEPVPRPVRRPCRIGEPHARAIDHIVLSAGLRASARGADMLPFSAREATQNRLSDHCPVRAELLDPTRTPPRR